MALIKCEDCGKGFSDQAAACPECGRPNGDDGPFGRRERGVTVKPDFWHDPNVGAVAGGVLIFVVVIAAAMVRGCNG